jgi:hypothetical protein
MKATTDYQSANCEMKRCSRPLITGMVFSKAHKKWRLSYQNMEKQRLKWDPPNLHTPKTDNRYATCISDYYLVQQSSPGVDEWSTNLGRNPRIFSGCKQLPEPSILLGLVSAMMNVATVLTWRRKVVHIFCMPLYPVVTVLIIFC